MAGLLFGVSPFGDGAEGEADLTAELEGPIFARSRDPTLVGAATLDPDLHTVVWRNGADLAPGFVRTLPSRARHSLWRTCGEPRAPLMRYEREVERAIRAGGMRWTVLQPSNFMEVWLSGALGWNVSARRPRALPLGPAHRIVAR